MNRFARSKVASSMVAAYARNFSVIAAKPMVARVAARQMLPSLAVSQQRSFSSKLGEILGSEIDHEESNQETDKEFLDLKKQVEKSFKIHDTAGSSVVKLTGTHGNESIVISFDCQDTAEEDNYEEDEEGEGHLGFGINFEVAITKGDKKMLVACVGGDGISVQSIRHLPANKDSTDMEGYGGPNFEDLDENVIDAFFEYLEERQINADLGHFVLAYSREKEQKEYVHWLKNVQEFVSK